MPILVGQVLFKAALLCIILRLLAKHEADFSFSKVAMVVAGITLGEFMLQVLLGKELGPLCVLPMLVFAVYMVKTFCWLSWGKAAIAIGIFSVFDLLMAFGVIYLNTQINQALNEPVLEGERRMEQAQNEILESMVESAQRAPGRPPIPIVPLEKLVAASPAPEPVRPATEPSPSSPALSTVKTDPASSTSPPALPPARTRPVQVVRAEPPQAPPPPAPETNPPITELTALPVELPDDWKEARKNLKIGGIMRDRQSTYVVLIDGRVREKGDTVNQNFRGKPYRWKVKSITPRGPVLEPVGL